MGACPALRWRWVGGCGNTKAPSLASAPPRPGPGPALALLAARSHLKSLLVHKLATLFLARNTHLQLSGLVPTNAALPWARSTPSSRLPRPPSQPARRFSGPTPSFIVVLPCVDFQDTVCK